MDILADEQNRQGNPDFSELRRLCDSGYPTDISSNLDVIYRVALQHWSIYGRGKGLAWLREMVAARYLLEYRYIRSKWRNKANSFVKIIPQASESSVLVPFVPCRRDLQAFLYPVTNILSECGVDTFILFPRKHSMDAVDIQLFTGSHFLLLYDYSTFRAYRRARKQYNALVPWLNKLGSQLRLDPRQYRRMHGFFQSYYRDKEIFKNVLTFIRPSVVYGIHYIINPGYLAAIDELRGKGTRPIKLLIQHGTIAPGSFHDFKGADCVVLWGDYFKSVLSSDHHIPVPPSRVVGNPKMEVEIRKREERMGYNDYPGPLNNKKVILYASTVDHPVGADYNLRALQLFAYAMRACSCEWSVFYKPHPGETLDVYRLLVQKGLIKQQQIFGRSDVTYDLLERADVVVGTNSSVLPEAMALGKPTIQILPALSGTDWCAYGLLGVSTEEGLCTALKGILGSVEYREKVLSAQQNLVEKMFGKTMGASQNIADYIMTFL